MTLVKVCLGPGSKCRLLDAGSLELKPEERVVVEGEDGLKLGRVMGACQDLDLKLPTEKLKSVVRLATPEDLAQEEKNLQLQQKALDFCQKRIQAHKLPIYLVVVECLFDASKIVFYFTAPGRVDFRELVKDLVQEFRTRIELRQIGVLHRAKMVGGLGICGRLMCCLTYEYSTYQQIRRHLPRVGKRLQLPEGEGRIIRYNFIRETVTLEMEDKRELEIPLAQLAPAEAGVE